MNRHDLITKALHVSDMGEIEGIAWPFGSPDQAGDVIHPGAFGTISGPLPILWQHRPDEPIGTWDAIEEKADGLHVMGRLLIEHSPRAREAHAFLKDGAVNGLSIGFRLERKAMSRRTGTGRDIRAEHGLRLAEISIVTRPSHPGARVTSTKSAAEIQAVAAALARFRASIRA